MMTPYQPYKFEDSLPVVIPYRYNGSLFFQTQLAECFDLAGFSDFKKMLILNIFLLHVPKTIQGKGKID